MSRKWAGLGRERHDRMKVAVMGVALFAFIVAWLAFARSHGSATTEALVLSGGATGDPALVVTPTASIGTATGGAAPAPTATPTSQAAPPRPVPGRSRTTGGS